MSNEGAEWETAPYLYFKNDSKDKGIMVKFTYCNKWENEICKLD